MTELTPERSDAADLTPERGMTPSERAAYQLVDDGPKGTDTDDAPEEAPSTDLGDEAETPDAPPVDPDAVPDTDA